VVSKGSCVYYVQENVRVLRKHLSEAGAPFTSWDSLSSLFIAASKSPDETLKEGRRWLDLVTVYRVWILWRIC